MRPRDSDPGYVKHEARKDVRLTEEFSPAIAGPTRINLLKLTPEEQRRQDFDYMIYSVKDHFSRQSGNYLLTLIFGSTIGMFALAGYGAYKDLNSSRAHQEPTPEERVIEPVVHSLDDYDALVDNYVLGSTGALLDYQEEISFFEGFLDQNGFLARGIDGLEGHCQGTHPKVFYKEKQGGVRVNVSCADLATAIAEYRQ